MNIEKICSPFTDIDALTQALNDSHPEFKRGVLDMCAAFNLKAEVLTSNPNSQNSNNIWLLTQNGWVAGRLLYSYDYNNANGEKQHYFKFVSRAVKKAKGDARADRNARAANKIRDLIKVLRMKKEMVTDENAFEYEKRAIGYAYQYIQDQLDRHKKPKIVVGHDAAEAVFRALFDGVTLPEVWRAEMEQAKAQFGKEQAAYEEATASLRLFQRDCYAVGLFDHWTGKAQYFVGKVRLEKDANQRLQITVQEPMKRYKTLVGTPLEADAAIIRTYMQSQSNYDEKNELGLPRRDHYYNDIEVATGYAGDTMMWALLPERV